MVLALLNHLCPQAPTDLGPSQDREPGLGWGPCCVGRGWAVTGLLSAGPGSQAAAAAQDLRGGDRRYSAHHSLSSTFCLDLSHAQGSPSAVRHRLFGGGRVG